MRIGGTIGDPIVTDIVVAVVTLTLIVGLGADITKQMVEKSHEIELDKCQDRFGSNFSNGTMDGEFVCMKDGEVYNPDVHALNSETGNILAQMFAPIQVVIEGFIEFMSRGSVFGQILKSAVLITFCFWIFNRVRGSYIDD